MDRFKLSSEQCELLLALEHTGSIKDMATFFLRDQSVISRQIQAIAAIAPVLEKQEKRWVLSTLGRQLNHLTREMVESQNRLLQERITLKISTTREFSAKILTPNIRSLIRNKEVALTISVSDDGVESSLLSGQADIGIDCGRPEDPQISFKSVLPEPYVVVASPRFLKEHAIRDKDALLASPHLRFRRDPALQLLRLKSDIPNVFASFNDIAGVRAGCCAGLGWATLPRYAVFEDINNGRLQTIPGFKFQPRSFGVWWVRRRQSAKIWADQTIKWLSRQVI